ncbi:MAG: SHOCT domain-containing protein [Nanoarchaeota archaeon]|nr:SHOCT domain-containing protein [DPANN group archaeon]MBL7116218.1 SHOCT domain-containing protein [Nanoarchaeota archaeon]
MMHGYSMGYGFMGFGWISQIIILILFFLVVWWLIRNSGSFGYKCGENETATDILKKRLAAGEISQKEYQNLKKEIEKD